MIVVGLTGNVAAGKSAVAALWREAGVPVASADDFAREAVQPGTPALAAIAELLGERALRPDGSLDRAAARRIVFYDHGARRALEAIVHPEVRRLRDEWTARRRGEGAELAAWEVPLLFETGMDKEVDLVVVVDAPAKVRRDRLVRARGLDAAEAEAVMAAQVSAERKRRRAHLVIDNGGGRAELAKRAGEVLARIRWAAAAGRADAEAGP